MKVAKRIKFFPYYGGKGSIARLYPPPKFDTIIEPFAGAANYSVMYWEKQVYLYDLNPKVIGVWNYLIRTPSVEVANLPIHFENVQDLKICQEAKWLIGWCIAKGSPTPRNKATPWAKAAPDSMWGSIMRQKLAKQVNSIRHWKAEVKDYREIHNQKATWFIDPPYQEGGHAYTHGKNGIDYQYLGDWCRCRLGQAIVCEAGKAGWLPFRTLRMCTGVKNGEHGEGKYKEVVWTND